MEDLIRQYGYLVVFIGTFLEGETIYLITAYLSHAGYLQQPEQPSADKNGNRVQRSRATHSQTIESAEKIPNAVKRIEVVAIVGGTLV